MFLPLAQSFFRVGGFLVYAVGGVEALSSKQGEVIVVKKKMYWLKLMCLLIVMFALVGCTNARSTAQQQVSAFAQQLGYVPEAHLAEYETCWGMFPSHCGQILYYATLISQDGFQAKIDQLTSTKELPQDISIYTLLDINLVTDYTITIDKIDSANDRTHTPPEPLAYKWRLTEGGDDWVIVFYEVAHDGYVYEIDGQPIIGNIVTIMLQTK